MIERGAGLQRYRTSAYSGCCLLSAMSGHRQADKLSFNVLQAHGRYTAFSYRDPLDRSFRNVARTWRFQFAVFKSK
jgi:hypothetical protein